MRAADVRDVQRRARDSTSGTRLKLGGADHGRVRGLLHDDQDVKSQLIPSVARSMGRPWSGCPSDCIYIRTQGEAAEKACFTA